MAEIKELTHIGTKHINSFSGHGQAYVFDIQALTNKINEIIRYLNEKDSPKLVETKSKKEPKWIVSNLGD